MYFIAINNKGIKNCSLVLLCNKSVHSTLIGVLHETVGVLITI